MHSGSSMISRHDDALQTRVGAILAVPAGQRADLIGSFIADYQEQFARLAGRLCTTFRVPADEAASAGRVSRSLDGLASAAGAAGRARTCREHAEELLRALNATEED